MLTFLRGKAGDRQLRLFACSCCRSVLGFVPVGPCRDALEVAERFADGRATRDELAAVRARAVAAATHSASWAACETANPSAMQAARAASDESLEHIRRQSPAAAADEARAQAGFLRDIVGDPFRPATLRAASRSARIRRIAEELRDCGRQEDWPILAVELERAGCPQAVVDHCRGEGPHVRGCWVIDLILSDAPVDEPEPTPTFEPLASIEQIRRAMANFLGPKKYRRFLRKGIANSSAPGRLARQDEWERFVALHPACVIPDEQYDEAFAVCCVHGCKLVERTIRGFVFDEPHVITPAFLQARATEFPHSYRELSEACGEHRVWWCATCQDVRERWYADPTSE
jgi:hypothetical protein